jgi:tripartite-type tricarboxylate transporter receptor subunit TctC
MAEWLQQRLGQTFIVENRPGAAANVATEQVARSPADGYTLDRTALHQHGAVAEAWQCAPKARITVEEESTRRVVD